MPQVLSSHLTQNLDRGVRRLLAMWVYVKHDLENTFVLLEAPTIAEQQPAPSEEGSVDNQNTKRGEQLVSLADFKVRILNLFLSIFLFSVLHACVLHLITRTRNIF